MNTNHRYTKTLLLMFMAGLLALVAPSLIEPAQADQAEHQTHDGHGEEHAVAEEVEHADHHPDGEEGEHADHASGHGVHGDHPDPVGQMPLWTVIPFIGILLSIALGPLVAPHFWHHHFPKISAFWALLFAVPFLIFLKGTALQSIIHIYLIDYIPFIILLWALFTISGGIFVGGSMRGTPKVNLILLVIGTFLASWIGTTGAAMVMIRPVLRANSWRKRKVHVIVFFIFLVANIGGSLTPLGDPPLFLGFLHNVPFFWVTTGLLKQMLVSVALLLGIFMVVDSYFYRKETEKPVAEAGGSKIKIEGLHNLIFLGGVMAAVIFSGAVRMQEIPIYGHVTVELQNWIRDGFLILMGVCSLLTTRQMIRKQNEFSWFPIQEVAYLFAGIFMTIIPALAILKAGPNGALASLTEAIHGPLLNFWATGMLSSFLDNAPTYLTFFNAALGDLGRTEAEIPGMLGYVQGVAANPTFIENLTAISAGAVFMGANTYIGNAPNFMVKAIAEEAGIPMPTFFGYMIKYSLPILIPVFVIITLIFFR